MNGSTLKKTDVSVASCVGTTGSIPTTGKLFTGTVLSKGIYTCTARANGYDDVPFWVVVGDSHRGNLPITFVETDQKIAAGGSKQVHVMIPPNTPSVQLSVRCPTVNEDDDLTYVVEGGSQEGNTCTFSVQGDASGSKSVHLFTVNAKAGATTGSIMFQLLSGDGYSIGSPYTSEVYMASLATLERVEVTEDDITAYCNEHPGCPPVGSRSESAWPNCTTDETWVEPTGITYGTDQKNNRWTLVVGGSGTLQFTGRDIENCVTIIPTENNSIDISTIVAGAAESEHLRASLKALEKTVALTFVGDVSNNPSISIYINGTKTGDCVYESSGDDKTCYVHAFSGQSVSFSIDKSLYPLFNYWSCSGASCPTTSAISSTTYDSFTLRDDNSVVYAHFNESDKHCFFDEFKNGTVSCVSKDTVYCVHNCGSSNDDICVSATDVTEYKAKWHLMSGKKSDIYEEAGNISLRRQGRTNVDPVTVLSTVNAGVYGTLKALFQLPKETANHNRNTAEISKSGFLLHSNTTGSEYLMLNMFAGRDGYLTAQLCSNNGRCLDGKLANGYGNFASVYASNMIMMAATIGVDGNLTVAAFTGNYYGTPDEYDIVFNLDELGSSYMDVAHEFVGFSLADPNFKLYGIGWKSDSYSAQCHDTYPIVKCSFAAVSTNGVIPTEKNVKPWVGHSGWFDSESCTDNYFYYNGGDLRGCSAANSDVGEDCGSDSLYFEEAGKGTHGYTNTETGKEMKTVKATLSCTPSSTETASWASTVERAHCGPFWTGKIQECTDHAALATNQNIGADLETTVTLTNTANLRATTLAIELNETTSNIDLDIWLVSDNSGYYDEGDTSKSVHMTSQKAEFNVDDAMSAGAGGFDPEHVKQIVIKNRGTSALYAKSIVASCKNATDITACSANYADGKWTVLVDVVNKDEIASFGAEAKVDGATVFEISSTNPTVTDGKIALEHADNPYAEHQGKSYGFTASIVNKTGTTASKACTVNPQTIGSITRSCDVTGSPKKQGEGLPQFNINISGCPSTGCSYEVYIGDAMLDGYPKNTTSASINLTPDGNGNTPQGSSTQTSDYAVGTYTYKVKSPDTATYPFSECSKTFEITEKGNTNTEAKTECWFASSNIQPGANANFKAYVNSHGYNICNRAYELRNSSGTKVAEGTSTGCNSELSFDISGTKTLTSDDFKLYVREGNSFVSACYADASLTVQELSPTCSINNEGKFQAQFTQICANSVCTYEVKKTVGTTTTSVTGSAKTLNQNTITESLSGYGNYVLWLNGVATTCAQTVKPVVTCPAAKKEFVINQQASLLMSDLKNCGSGCNYNLVVDGTSVKTVTDGSYSSASTAITFTPTQEDDDLDYTFTVYANGDNTLVGSCSGEMEFSATQTCTDKGSWDITSNNGNAPNLPWAAETCFSVSTNRICSGQLKIKSEDCKGKTATLNGVSIYIDPGNSLYDVGSFPAAARGLNLKLEMPEKCRVTEFFVDGCQTVSDPSSVPEISGCPANAIVTWPNETVHLPMTLSNCVVTGGCTYTLTASGQADIKGTVYGSNIPSLNATSSDNTTISYTLSVKNNAGEATSTCEFSVTTDSDARLNKSIPNNSNVTFGPGKYEISCNGKGSTMTVQPQQQSTECSGWFEPSISSFSGGPWNNCDWQASVSNPVDFTVPSGKTLTLKCY